jgi:putative transposase
MTTNAYIRGVRHANWRPFDGKLWQRSYHDHIIRGEKDFLHIQQYIQENPARWEQDTFFDEK